MKLSIIVPLLNGGRFIKGLIDSIITQNISDYELIIKDGLSSDDGLKIIENFSADNIKIISKKDSGIYDAMNQGIENSSGDWIVFMGADDKFLNGSNINSIIDNKINEYDILYGDFILNGKYHNAFYNWRLLNGNSINHQSIFYSRKIFEFYKYDTGYKIASDYKLNLALFLSKKTALYIPRAISEFGGLGLSMTNKELGDQEACAIRIELLGRIIGVFINLSIKIKNYLK
jgi:glycosyltransferase involved in cell wall biosynthesis